MALPVEINPLQLKTSGGYTVSKSLRFRSSASANLSRTFSAVPTTRTKQTISTWVKRGSLGSLQDFFAGYDGSSTNSTDIQFAANDTLIFEFGGSSTFQVGTTQVFRDPSAWYHIVASIDTTQATAANRVILYVNGAQVTSYALTSYPAQNAVSQLTLNNANNRVGSQWNSSSPFDGYLAEFYFIDGQALTPSSFGAYDTNGVWQPIKYSGTYGTNGFYLPFSLNSTSSYAGSFNGTSQSLATTSGITNQFTPTSGFTLEMWAYQNNSGSNQGFYVGGGANSWSTSNGYLFGLLFGSAPQWQWNNAGATFTIGFSIPANQWAHIAIGYNGTTTRVWVNGISVGTSTSSYTIPSSVNQYVIGSNIGATSNYYTGNLSNLRFVKGTDVYGVGNATIAVPTGPLTAITNTQLLTLQNSTVIDNSTNAFTIINTGSVTTATATPFVENIFADASGNNNTWAGNNINYSTAGSTYDSMNDSPTVTSATVANYAVLNPLDFQNANTYSNGNLSVSLTNVSQSLAFSGFGLSSGKWYWEVKTTAGADAMLGVALQSGTMSSRQFTGANSVYYYGGNGNKYVAGTSSAYGATYGTADTIGIALDLSANTITYYKNNASQGAISLPSQLLGVNIVPAFSSGTGTVVQSMNVNFGQQPFFYTPPTGFNALNTYNLPTPTIANGAQYMAATTYTGDGTSSKAINNGTNNAIGTTFQPDLVWLKVRNAIDNHGLIDVVRGAPALISSNLTAAEIAAPAGGSVGSFSSTGFTIAAGSTNNDNFNKNANTYVGWQWKASGSTVSNTNGSITSTVSANTTAGFSVMTYTGTGASNATVGHGLGVIPSMVIVKARGAATDGNWRVKTTGLSSNNNLVLNLTDAQFNVVTSANGGIGDLSSSTTFTLANGTATNNNVNQSTITYVAYCWAAVPGYSAFGSYTGNGSTDGPFVYTGFRPRFILTKRTDAVNTWELYDTSRSAYNAATAALYPNTSAAETTDDPVDILSNGFKMRASGNAFNTSGGTYIYAAFAENPFQNSRAR